ncbi:MAG: extracellular solute-binding protein [Planctomycetes bacterium]|nr:extracellular solute-binding protein [Planctomycetota bacterium]
MNTEKFCVYVLRWRFSVVCLSLAITLLCGCGKQETNTITVYVSADEQIARIVIDDFTSQTGIEVAWVGDTEASKTTGLVTRLRREASRPVADVFWSSENIGTIQLAQEGVFDSCSTTVTAAWPAEYRDPSAYWFAFSPRARVIAYDPTVTNVKEMPAYWWEYTDAAMADPRFGTTGTHLAVMAEDANRFNSFAQELGNTPLLGGNAATVQAVIDGSARYAMTDSDDVHAAIARGASIAMLMPRHHAGVGGGTLLIPNTVAMIADCQHPEQAKLFIDFMLSDHVATLLAESSSKNIPLQKTVAEQFPDLVVQDPLQVDFIAAAKRRNKTIDLVMQSLKEARAK